MPPVAAPPGPDSNVLAQTVAFHRDPLEFLRRRQRELGDVFQIRLLTARPTFVVTEPEAVKALLGADPKRAHAGEARRAVLPFASTRSVFGGDAEAHRSARARIAPAFAPELMESRHSAIAAIAERHAAAWPLGSPFRLLSRVRTLCDERSRSGWCSGRRCWCRSEVCWCGRAGGTRGRRLSRRRARRSPSTPPRRCRRRARWR